MTMKLIDSQAQFRELISSTSAIDGYEFRGISFESPDDDSWFCEYEFRDCLFTNVAINGMDFSDCAFERAVFVDGRLHGCSFQTCKLDISLDRTKLEVSRFYGCTIEEFNCEKAVLKHNLFEANHFFQEPVLPLGIQAIPNIGQKIAEIVVNHPDRLDMSSWHNDCHTTHCIAGWAIVLHPRGLELEKMVGPRFAGRLLFPEAEQMFDSEDDEAIEFLKTFLA